MWRSYLCTAWRLRMFHVKHSNAGEKNDEKFFVEKHDLFSKLNTGRVSEWSKLIRFGVITVDKLYSYKDFLSTIVYTKNNAQDLSRLYTEISLLYPQLTKVSVVFDLSLTHYCVQVVYLCIVW